MKCINVICLSLALDFAAEENLLKVCIFLNKIAGIYKQVLIEILVT